MLFGPSFGQAEIIIMATRPRQDEPLFVIYGIDPKTFEVVKVLQTRGGKLSAWFGGRYVTHYVMPGRRAEAEVSIVWGLVHVESVPLWMDQYNTTSAALKAKAAEMAAAAGKA